MREVECWCCEHFKNSKEELRGNHYYVVAGICTLKGCEVATNSKVCEDYIMLSGLRTNRIIPDYCKNYNGIG